MSIGLFREMDLNPLFDSTWYRSKYLGTSEVVPILDYLSIGWLQGRRPNPYFDGSFYEILNPQAAGVNPLVHFISIGEPEGLSPTPMFDLQWYIALRPDASCYPGGAFAHFCRIGAREGASPSPLFDSDWYVQQNEDVRAAHFPPFQHYSIYGRSERRSPHPLFDPSFYLDQNPDVLASDIDPLTHFLTSGHLQGRKPHILFDVDWYRAAYNIPPFTNPLIHYLKDGDRLGFNPNPLFDTKWYVTQLETGPADGKTALGHYVVKGLEETREPSPLFDTDAYIAENPDVLASSITPLAHFISSGRGFSDLSSVPHRGVERCPVIQIPFQVWKTPNFNTDDEICVFVTYSTDGSISSHVDHYIEQLILNGLKILLVVATDGIVRPIPLQDRVHGMIVRSNHGWDFAAWAAALTIFPILWHCKRVVLANDSVFGPIDSSAFSVLLNRSAGSEAEVWSITESYQVKHHLMSYFVVLTGAALRSKSVRRFWEHIESLKDKQQVINNYEINGIASWEQSNVRCQALFPAEPGEQRNPTLDCWQELIKCGMPFIKVELLRRGLVEKSECWERFFAKEPELLSATKGYLEKYAYGRPLDHYSPVPPPWRKFKRDGKLKTFYGAVRATRPTRATDFAFQVPFEFGLDPTVSPKVAVFAHIYYEDLAQEISSRLSQIPGQVDIYISTDVEHKRKAIHQAFLSHKSGLITIRIMPNVGRDIAPLLVGFRDVIHEYDAILHIHSKKSPHGTEFSGWREFMFDNLIGNVDVVRSVFKLLELPEVGMVFSQHFAPVRPVLNWGGNFEQIKRLLAPLGHRVRKDLVLEFPAGSFFWAKPQALGKLLELDLKWEDFPIESGQVDGTLAHAIERSLLFFCEASGFKWSKVSRLTPGEKDTNVVAVSDESMRRLLPVVHRPLLLNYIPSLQSKKAAAELVNVSVRRGDRTKGRFNLVIPSLHKSHYFGGTATAVRVFQEVSAQLGDWDFRIICTSVPLDMESMRSFPDWRLEIPGAEADHCKRAIVDLSGGERGSLTIGKNDVFMSTAWWTAELSGRLLDAQMSFFGTRSPHVYLIQDYEPNFYPWSDQYVLAEATYKIQGTIAIINSEELSEFMSSRYLFESSCTLKYSINAEIARGACHGPKERIFVFYGRPSVSRNLFNLVCSSIVAWQQSNPETASMWQVVSAGETYAQHQAGGIQNLSVLGKLELSEYSDLLSKAAVGLSLMLSPHPSYPPLEMALFGLETITNGYTCKDLSRRSPLIDSIEHLSVEAVVTAIEAATERAEASIGTSRIGGVLTDMEGSFEPFEPGKIAGFIAHSTRQ